MNGFQADNVFVEFTFWDGGEESPENVRQAYMDMYEKAVDDKVEELSKDRDYWYLVDFRAEYSFDEWTDNVFETSYEAYVNKFSRSFLQTKDDFLYDVASCYALAWTLYGYAEKVGTMFRECAEAEEAIDCHESSFQTCRFGLPEPLPEFNKNGYRLN
jgi:hypothetical protein